MIQLDLLVWHWEGGRVRERERECLCQDVQASWMEGGAEEGASKGRREGERERERVLVSGCPGRLDDIQAGLPWGPYPKFEQHGAPTPNLSKHGAPTPNLEQTGNKHGAPTPNLSKHGAPTPNLEQTWGPYPKFELDLLVWLCQQFSPLMP